MKIDRKSGGYLVRVFNSNQTLPGARMKHDMIGVTYKTSEEDGGHMRMETRVIVEVVNDYTFIIDRPFDNLNNLPEVILDFKFIVVEGARGGTTSTHHHSSGGLSLIHARFAFCPLCTFP